MGCNFERLYTVLSLNRDTKFEITKISKGLPYCTYSLQVVCVNYFSVNNSISLEGCVHGQVSHPTKNIFITVIQVEDLLCAGRHHQKAHMLQDRALLQPK